ILSRTGTGTELSRVRKLQKPDIPVVPASSSMLIGSSLRFCREREALIQLSFEMAQELIGDEAVIFDRLAFGIEVREKLAGPGRLGNGRIGADGREQGNVVLPRKRRQAVENNVSHLEPPVDLDGENRHRPDVRLEQPVQRARGLD